MHCAVEYKDYAKDDDGDDDEDKVYSDKYDKGEGEDEVDDKTLHIRARTGTRATT